MPKFSNTSKTQLATCDKRIQNVMNEVIKYIDFAVVEGFRNKAAQDKAFATGKSKVRWPYGNHNKSPSKAVDIAPWPIDWSDNEKALRRFVFLAGHVMAVAKIAGIKFRWGGDWNGNDDLRDENGLIDFPHFEVLD